MERTTKLVAGFAEALRQLVPHFERAGINWKSGEQYDNYDRIAEILFRELVLNPLTYEIFGEEKSYQYDMPPYEAPWGGLRVIDGATSADLGQFVRIASMDAPMDAVTYLTDSREENARLNDSKFELAIRQR